MPVFSRHSRKSRSPREHTWRRLTNTHRTRECSGTMPAPSMRELLTHTYVSGANEAAIQPFANLLMQAVWVMFLGTFPGAVRAGDTAALMLWLACMSVMVPLSLSQSQSYRE
eukprot:278335-Chlamydomonas_euryale.AAC.5